MNRQQKSDMIDSLKQRISESQAAFLVGYRGLTVVQMQELRKDLRSKGGSLQVTKARLMKIAVHGKSEADMLTPHLHDQIGMVFASNDVAGIAKTLNDFAKNHQALKLIAGCMESRLLDSQAVARIASLPSREVLLAQLCGTLKAPTVGLATVLNQVILKLMWTLKQIEETKK
jgi:large subunit ribosomal protein L10